MEQVQLGLEPEEEAIMAEVVAEIIIVAPPEEEVPVMLIRH